MIPNSLKWILGFWTLMIAALVVFGASRRSDFSVRAQPIFVVHDPGNSLDPAAALQANWQLVNHSTLLPEPGITWLKIPVPPETGGWADQAVLFSGSTEMIPAMSGFAVEEGGGLNFLGTCEVRLRSHTCALPNLQYAFPFPKNPERKITDILLKVDASITAAQTEFFIMSRAYYNRVNSFLSFYEGFGFGIALFVTGMALLLHNVTGESSVLIFAAYSLTAGLSNFLYRGGWDAFRPFDQWPLAAYLHPFTLTLGAILNISFVRFFFKLKKNYPRVDTLLECETLIFLGVFLVNWIGPMRRVFWIIMPAMLIAESVVSLMVVAYLILVRQRNSLAFLLSWGTGLCSYITWSIYHLGIISPHWMIGYAPMIFRPFEMLLIAIVVSQRTGELVQELSFARANEEKNKLIRTLLRVVCHDLSNTTNAILFGATGASQADSLEKAKASLARVHIAAEAQADIIQHARTAYLHDDAKIKLEPVNLVESLETALTMFEPRLLAKNITVARQFTTDATTVWADPVSLTYQVIANILDNAVKFSPPNCEIGLRTYAEQGNLVLELSDHGMGIPPEVRERLSENKVLPSRAGTQDELGTGNGLLLVRDFMRAYGAKLDFADGIAVGTKVLLKFPFHPQ